MILDNQTLFSDQQAVTASAASTNQIDLSPRETGVVRDIGPGQAIPIIVQVTEAFATLTSLTVAIQTDEDVAFGSPVTVAASAAIPVATLKPGYQIPLSWVPVGVKERYVRLFYTVTGTNASAGRITAGVGLGHQTNG